MDTIFIGNNTGGFYMYRQKYMIWIHLQKALGNREEKNQSSKNNTQSWIEMMVLKDWCSAPRRPTIS